MQFVIQRLSIFSRLSWRELIYLRNWPGVKPTESRNAFVKGLHHLESEISSFDRMLEGIQMVLGPERRTANS